MSRTAYSVSLGLALAAYWLLLSGKTDHTLLLALGGASVVFVVLVVDRMGLMDVETAPFHRILALLRYWVWLGGEITKANIIVARTVMRADLDITPRLFKVTPRQESEFGRTVFANSITLTPGTVAVAVGGDEFIVHALTDSFADPAGVEEMNARAARATEGAPW